MTNLPRALRCVCGCAASYHRAGTGACSVCALEDVQCFQFRTELVTSAAIRWPVAPLPREVARPLLVGILLGLGVAGVLAQAVPKAPSPPCVCADQDRATVRWTHKKCLDPECREVLKLGGP